MAKRTLTPFWWFLMGAGGMVSAMLFPVHVLLFGLAFPLGWFEAPAYESLHALVAHPITRLYLFVFIFLPLFHAAHRIRYTVYDLFRVQPSMHQPIAVVCYGAATAGTIAAAYTLLTIS
ncbi:MAG: fumarate reductase subunit D [Acidobacteria bacterium]|nr:fumarate reductase subunit D [Acidobacteriota bacterium]